MTRARYANRKAWSNGAINKGVGHGIKKTRGKKRLNGKHTNIKPFGEYPPSPKVKPADRVALATTSPSEQESTGTEAASQNRFFRSRDLNRKATVSMSKGLKYEVTSGGLVRSPAPARKGPFKSLPAPARQKAALADPPPPRDLLTAIDDEGSAESTPSRPDTPAGSLRLVLAESDDEPATPRRSPRKHQRPTAELAAEPSPAATPLRRSPRKQARPPPTACARPTHAENEGPTRMDLTPRRSPRKHQQSRPQMAAQSPARTPRAVYDRLEEQLMQMEAGEDKENESPARRKKDEQPKFYSIFYRKAGGEVETRGDAPQRKGQRPPPPKSQPRQTGRPGRAAAAAGRDAEDGLEQLVIDAGQRQFGVITCSVCTLVYTIGDPEDEALHARHHTGYLSALTFPGWKREHEVGHYMDGRVVMVAPRDPAHAWRKVDGVLRIVDAELGFVGVGVRNKEQSKVFFYVVERQIVGCLVAEPVSRGFAVLPRNGSAGRRATVSCETSSRPCRVGVSRVWVHCDYRRRGLARRLLDAMRNHFAMGPLQWQDVAFSDPTPDGLELAAAVTGTQQFLVYNQ